VHHTEDLISLDTLTSSLARAEVLRNDFHHLKVGCRESGILFKIGNLVPLGLNVLRGELLQVEEVASSSLPSELSYVTGTDLEERTGLFARFMAKIGNKRSNILRLDIFENFFRKNCLGHARCSQWANSVNTDVAFLSLLSKRLR
jgi:hypothetical protein